MTIAWRERVYWEVTNSYLETALWSSYDYSGPDENDDRPFDEDYDYTDFSDEARTAAYADCKRFMECLENTILDDDDEAADYADLWEAADHLQGFERIGHDFWLTRNGHGAGFWDGDYSIYGDRICEVLYKEFGRYAELTPYVNSEGRIDFE